ncbi:MAG: acyl-CoA dehydratase activase [Phycisphaeraceae bacterium]
MICAGIDSGSRALKAVLYDPDQGKVVAAGMRHRGIARQQLAEALLNELLDEVGLARSDVGRVVATGYGRSGIDLADRAVTEITCHARGVHQLVPEARTIIEIGGQDSKVIRLAPGGRVEEFAMNDRCAAGTGCFLEMVANRLDLSLDALGELAEQSGEPANISSMCAVFAETEIIGLLADGTEPRDIVAGVEQAVARRIAALAGRAVAGPVVFTGGVARIGGMSAALAAAARQEIHTPPDPQFTGALGAALIAAG